MSPLITIWLSALATAILLMATVWKLWPSWRRHPGNGVTVAAGVSASPPRRHSSKQAPSRP